MLFYLEINKLVIKMTSYFHFRNILGQVTFKNLKINLNYKYIESIIESIISEDYQLRQAAH